MEIEKVLLKTMPFIAAILSMTLIIVLQINSQPGKVIQTYERINNRLRRQRNYLFDYEKTKEFLQANGAAFHFGKWVEPIKYYALRLILAACMFFVGMRMHGSIAVVAALLGYYMADILLIYLNKSDNEKMLMQIQTVYNALIVQIKAGVYVSDALAECYSSLEPGRLRSALEEVAGDLFIKSSLDIAVTNFNAKFHNGFIDSLCIILLQGKETGKSVELLSDMSEQIKDMNTAYLLKKKTALDNTVNLCTLGVFAAFIAVILYAFVMDIFTTVNAL